MNTDKLYLLRCLENIFEAYTRNKKEMLRKSERLLSIQENLIKKLQNTNAILDYDSTLNLAELYYMDLREFLFFNNLIQLGLVDFDLRKHNSKRICNYDAIMKLDSKHGGNFQQALDFLLAGEPINQDLLKYSNNKNMISIKDNS